MQDTHYTDSDSTAAGYELPLIYQFNRIIGGYDTEHVTPKAVSIARTAYIAERTGWSRAEIEHLDLEYAEALILFWELKDRDDRTKENSISRKLSIIADKAIDISKAPHPELMSWGLQKRLMNFVDLVVDQDTETGKPKLNDNLLSIIKDLLYGSTD